MKKYLFLVFLVVMMASPAGATYTGSLQETDSSLTATTNWDDAVLSWEVYQDVDTQLWVYKYVFDITEMVKDLSHIIFEVSPTFTAGHLFPGTSDGYEVGTFGPGPSNPGIPGDVYGIKWDVSGMIDAISIVTDYAPAWGDAYAKDGVGGGAQYAYNTEFGNDTLALVGNGNAGGWTLIPGSEPVPEPSTMLLLGCGLFGMVISATRRRRKG